MTGSIRFSSFQRGLAVAAVLTAVLGLGLYMASHGGVLGDGGKSPLSLAKGQALYGEHCASCHGANLEGQPNWRSRLDTGRMPAPPHDESGHTWHHADAQLFDITKRGVEAIAPEGYRSDMAGFGDVLSDAEIWAVMNFIKSTWPEEIQVRQAHISGQAN